MERRGRPQPGWFKTFFYLATSLFLNICAKIRLRISKHLVIRKLSASCKRQLARGVGHIVHVVGGEAATLEKVWRKEDQRFYIVATMQSLR